MFFCPLSSGSKANSSFASIGKLKILIDAGLSCKATIERLNSIGVDINEINAIFVTHEHLDHIKGINVINKKFNIPIITNAETSKIIQKNSDLKLDFQLFSTGIDFQFMDINIHPFSINHDAVNPVGFTFSYLDKKLSYCTDLGFPTTLVKTHLNKSSILYLESNHCPKLVYQSERPFIYKQRVLSRSGHLSNEQSSDILKNIDQSQLESVYLAHISSECNTETLALTKNSNSLKENVNLYIAKQDNVSERTSL